MRLWETLWFFNKNSSVTLGLLRYHGNNTLKPFVLFFRFAVQKKKDSSSLVCFIVNTHLCSHKIPKSKVSWFASEIPPKPPQTSGWLQKDPLHCSALKLYFSLHWLKYSNTFPLEFLLLHKPFLFFMLFKPASQPKVSFKISKHELKWFKSSNRNAGSQPKDTDFKEIKNKQWMYQT